MQRLQGEVGFTRENGKISMSGDLMWGGYEVLRKPEEHLGPLWKAQPRTLFQRRAARTAGKQEHSRNLGLARSVPAKQQDGPAWDTRGGIYLPGAQRAGGTCRLAWPRLGTPVVFKKEREDSFKGHRYEGCQGHASWKPGEGSRGWSDVADAVQRSSDGGPSYSSPGQPGAGG